MKKTAIAAAIVTTAALSMGASTAHAGAWSGEFCMFDSTGAAVSDFTWGTTCDQQVTGGIDTGAGTFSVGSPQTFFGQNWTAHDGVLYGEGTHTRDTIQGGIYTFTVGAGQIGGGVLFDWGAVADIDVVLVWDVATVGSDTVYTSTDWDGDGILGGKMIDGAFAGFSANFNMVEPVPIPAAVWLFGSGLLGLVGVARRKKATV